MTDKAVEKAIDKTIDKTINKPGTGPHFTWQEMACHHCGKNKCVQELVDALEALRALVNVPIKVHDAYRCAVHNAAVGGAMNSEHRLGLAADIAIDGMMPVEMYKAALQVPAFASGGIGVAEHQGYIHVDVRGTEARWCYDATGKPSAWDNALEV